MSFAVRRPYVRVLQQIPQPTVMPDIQELLQSQADAIHELNARIFFLQEQLAIVATASGATIDTLEDY